MMSFSKMAIVGIILAAASSVVGCGGSSNDNKDAAVTMVSTDDPSVVVGDDADLNVQFSFAHDTVVDDLHHVVVVVRIPAGLSPETATARIDELGGVDSVSPRVEACGNGDTFLTFDLEKRVLENASNPDGPADGKLIMAIRGIKSGSVTIEARAGYDIAIGSCSNGIIPQASSVFVVL